MQTSLVFTWHFPDRDFSHIILGNMYTEMWTDSAAVARALATESKLAQVVGDINMHHYAVASPDNPTPVWLKDQLVSYCSMVQLVKQLLVWLVWRTKHLTLWKLIMETLAVLGVDKQSGQVYQPRYFKRQVSRIS